MSEGRWIHKSGAFRREYRLERKNLEIVSIETIFKTMSLGVVIK